MLSSLALSQVTLWSPSSCARSSLLQGLCMPGPLAFPPEVRLMHTSFRAQVPTFSPWKVFLDPCPAYTSASVLSGHRSSCSPSHFVPKGLCWPFGITPHIHTHTTHKHISHTHTTHIHIHHTQTPHTHPPHTHHPTHTHTPGLEQPAVYLPLAEALQAAVLPEERNMVRMDILLYSS